MRGSALNTKDLRPFFYRGAPLFGLFVLLAALFISGCSAAPVSVKDEAQPQPSSLIWPPPPELARIIFVKAVSRPDDIGANKGFFKKLVEFVLGAEVNDIVKPYGVTADSAGRVIVADTAFKRVHIYDIKNSKYSYIDSAGDERLNTPIAAAVDAEDNIYVSDSTAGKVYAFDKKGSFLFDIKAGKRPTGITVNKAGKLLYAVDTASHNIGVFDLKGRKIKTIGERGDGNGKFNFPVDIFIDVSGDIYVADTMNYKVQVLDKDGRFISAFGKHGDGTGDFGRPKGIAVDRDGHVYVADALFDTVQIFDRSGKFLLNFGALGRGYGSFWMPAGIFIDGANKVYIADSYNMRVQIFEYIGN